jgi:hypothetical protein
VVPLVVRQAVCGSEISGTCRAALRLFLQVEAVVNVDGPPCLRVVDGSNLSTLKSLDWDRIEIAKLSGFFVAGSGRQSGSCFVEASAPRERRSAKRQGVGPDSFEAVGIGVEHAAWLSAA